jgi:5-oxoprolinase (ATP-hydrolysing)
VPSPGWEFWIDRGGTFTDIVARRPDGVLLCAKHLSQNPERYQDAAAHAVHQFLAEHPDFAAAPVEAIRMGTTVATNALLERTGERCVLVVTAGFADVLRIGQQHRPDLFARHVVLPQMLYSEVVEAQERLTADGSVQRPLDEDALARALERHAAAGLRSAAIVFVHGYLNPEHEQAAARIARQAGFTHVSVSHQVLPLPRVVGRGDTTVVDAYLSPILQRYVTQFQQSLAAPTDAGTVPVTPRHLLFMQSHGGLAEASHFRGKDAVLSGPAGGVIGMVRTAATIGRDRLIGFDMGGTSTDVALYAGTLERTIDSRIAGVRLRAPMLRIDTVAAGGGSVLRFADGRFQAGPTSAGADPGPACYRRGGPLTVTDANVLLGRIAADFFPHVFGPAGDQPLDHQVVATAFASLAERIAADTGRSQPPQQVAEGFLRIAVDNMAGAIKRISIQRGFDLSRFTLCCFGGAGGQHACQVADALGLKQVLIHPMAGVLSAYGMGLADVRQIEQHAVQSPLADDIEPRLEALSQTLRERTRAALLSQGVDAAGIVFERRVALRYAGTDNTLEVPYGSALEMRAAFATLHRQHYGFDPSGVELVVEALQVEAIAPGAPTDDQRPTHDKPATDVGGGAVAVRKVWFDGGWHDTPFHARERCPPDSRLAGPAVIVDAGGTTVVAPGWEATIDAAGNLLLERVHARAGESIDPDVADPVLLEVFNNRFRHIAEQMGVVLSQTASSVNIKERLDFSCAVFDRDGGLVANAPHMPVHLGSMGESVRAVIAAHAERMQPGDGWLLNAPYAGGTHLPDMTVVSPVYLPDPGDATIRPGTRPAFFVASRGHHADVGGISPGSMPAFSRHIDEEGVLFDGFPLVSGGRLNRDALLRQLSAGRWPARNPAQNLADLEAQVAANTRGALELARAAGHFGLDALLAYTAHVQTNAEQCVRRAIASLQPGSFDYPLDNGLHIRVRVSIDTAARTAVIDFTGTSAQADNNFNAPSAVCRAAVLYVFRTLVDRDIPMNEGCLNPIEIRIPPGSMLSPRYPAAVVAGNVETSQCITDALYGAMSVQAGAQGTMNNVTFGDNEYQYYETLCGGTGAGPGYAGTSAVHSHMTNSRLTDVEILETRLPVQVVSFAVRRGSGGDGRWRGGDGVVRKLRFLRPMTAALLTNNRLNRPFGMAGGQPGASGRNYVERAGGDIQRLEATAELELHRDDVLVVETPGGGGYGEVTDRQRR